MARPREFDEAEVLDAAVQCFWARGYEATSVRELASHMGITGASLYNAFGDKRALFRRALARYEERNFGARARDLEARLPPRQALEVFFDGLIERSLTDAERRGCMLVNSALDVTSGDPELCDAVAAFQRRAEAFFRRCIEAGQRDGTIAFHQPADDLARLLLGALMGIRVLARTRPERDLLEGLLRPAFALLEIE